jgi:hypothetical protein
VSANHTIPQIHVPARRGLADNLRTIDIPSSLAWMPGENFGYLTILGMVTEMAGDFRLPRNDREKRGVLLTASRP